MLLEDLYRVLSDTERVDIIYGKESYYTYLTNVDTKLLYTKIGRIDCVNINNNPRLRVWLYD
jgi:hypothetical protein